MVLHQKSITVYKILPKWKSCIILLFLTLKTLVGLIVKNKLRNFSEISKDYDQGSWKEVINEKRWLNYESFFEFITFENDDFVRIAKINNEIVKIKNSDYYKYRLKKLNEIILEHSKDKNIYELGCGWGLNLLSLSNNFNSLTGFDISQNAIKAGQQITQHFNILNINFKNIDLTNSNDAGWHELNDKTIFTYHSLEQLKHYINDVIQNILNSNAKRVIHFEPTVELYDLWSLRDLASYSYIKRRDYLSNLITTLESFEKQNKLKILKKERTFFSPQPRYDSTLIIWEPC